MRGETQVGNAIQNNGKSKERLFLLFLLFIPCLLIHLRFDNDTYWLINSGRYVLENGIPHMEPFTLHQGLHFVMQQWLSASLFALIYNTLGSPFLFVLVALVYGSILFSVYRLCMRVSEGNFLVSFTLTFAMSIPLNFFMVLRPYLLSVLLFTLELNLLEAYLQTRKNTLLLLLPILSVLLINLHAAMWPFLFILLIPYLIDSFAFKIWGVKGEGYPRLPLVLAALISFAAGFLNPYGFEGMTYLLRSYGNANVSAMVNEMQSPDFKTIFGIIVFLLYLVPVLILCIHTKKKYRLRYVLLAIGTAYLGLSSIRSLSLFIICTIPLLAYTLKSVKILKSENEKPGSIGFRFVFIGILAVILGSFFFLRAAKSEKEAEQDLPVQAVEYIKTLDDEHMRLFTGYAPGGYAEFQGLRPFIDARAEVFFKSNNGKEDIIDDYLNMELGKLHYRDLIDKYKLTHFLVDKTDILYVYLPSDEDFELLHEDATYKIYRLKAAAKQE